MSLKTSAASLYILHSGSSEVPSLWAKRIVAIRPILSWSTERRRAAVGDAEASPTPTPTKPCLSVSPSHSQRKDLRKRITRRPEAPHPEVQPLKTAARRWNLRRLAKNPADYLLAKITRARDYKKSNLT